MEVIDINFRTGLYPECFRLSNNRVLKVRRNCKYFKIGITHNYNERKDGYLDSLALGREFPYDRMEILYRTGSLPLCKKMEIELIKKFRDGGVKCKNVRDGGEGKIDKYPAPYYAYVVWKD